MHQNLHAPFVDSKEGSDIRIAKLELQVERMADFSTKLLQVVRQQQLQIAHDRGLLRTVLCDRVSSISPELLINQIDALMPGTSAGLLAQLSALEGWQDD